MTPAIESGQEAAAPVPMIYHPALGQTVNFEVRELPDDPDGQVAGTIALMRGYVLEDWQRPEVIKDAAEAQASILDADPVSQVFWWVKRLSFVEDRFTALPFSFAPDVVETLIRPVDMALLPEGRRQGDCDDFVMYAAALLKALGLNSRFVTLAADPREPGRYSHVYLAVYRNGERIPFDASHGAYPGWEAPNLFGKRREWEIFGPSLAPAVGILLGLGALALWRNA